MHQRSATSLRWACIAVTCVALARPVVSQDTSAKAQAALRETSFGAVDGTVIDTSGAGLPLVEIVMIDAPYTHVRTNSGGAYRLDSVESGFHLLRFRRVGLLPLTVPVTVRAGGVTGIDAVLGAVPHTLATVTIQDTLGEVLRLPPGVADRVRNGMGTYITAADIERRHPIRTSQMLQYVAGADLTKDGAVNNTRGVVSLKTPGCKYGLPIYVDGQRIADPHAGADTVHGSNLTDYVPPSDVAVIEVYRGPSELPATLPQDKCGGLFIWTKR